MADTIGGGINEDGSLQNTLVVDEASAFKLDVVELPNAGVTEVAVNGAIKDLAIGLKGDNDVVVAGKRLVRPLFSNEAEAGKTAKISLAVTKAKRPTFVTTGEGATDLTVAEGKFMRGTVTTADSDAADSITFGSSSIIKSLSISTNGGDDSITFNGRMKGKTTVAAGEGSDVIEVNRQSGKGKLILSDFSDDDTLIVSGETFTNDNIDDSPKWIKLDA